MKENIQVAQWIHEFLEIYAPQQLTTSEHTLRSYETTLTQYIEFLDTEKKIKPSELAIDSFNNILLEQWLTWLSVKRNNSPQTCNIRLANMRTFLKFLGTRKPQCLYLYQQAQLIEKRDAVRTKVTGLSKDALKVLFSLPDISQKMGRRDLVFMVFTYSTALRISEVLNLKIKDVHLNGRKPYVNVLGKGKKGRTVYLVKSAAKQLKGYVKEFHGNNPDPEHYLFYSRTKGKTGTLSPEAIKRMLHKYGKLGHEKCIEIPESLHCHQFRHARASHWLEEGMNLTQISFLLGHAHLSTTEVYLDITLEEELAAIDVFDEEDVPKIKKRKRQAKSLKEFIGIRNPEAE